MKRSLLKFKVTSTTYIIALMAVFVGICGGGTARGQDRVSLKDAKIMTYAAQSTVENLPRLLNYITDKAMEGNNADLKAIEVDSYKDTKSGNQLFVNGDVIVEDDVTPTSALGQAKDMRVADYLQLLSTMYVKTPDSNINFSTDLEISPIKKTSYFYVTVRFEETFSSTYKDNGKTYPPRMREALVHLYDRGNNQWQALIEGLRFIERDAPADPKHNVQIVADASVKILKTK